MYPSFFFVGTRRIRPRNVWQQSSEIQGTALGKCLRVQWNRGKDGQILVKEAEKASEMPVKHCLWGTCSSDSRFPLICEGVRFVPFAKPARTLETCLRLSKVCGRPHSQSNVSKILSSFLFLFYYSKRSEFRTRKERQMSNDQSNDH